MLNGTTLKGRYRLYERIATGGSATVYLARDTVVGRMVVVKLVHEHMLERRFLARFVREINILKDARSPHIVSIYDFAIQHEQDDLPAPVTFIAMAYVEGLTLANIVRRLETLTERNTLALGRQLALALAELHRLGIVHRDLKSQNIMVQANDTSVVLDFGIAKNLNEETLTGANVFAGTLAYAAPEQLLDSRNVDIRADMYSLGVIMVECLTGRLPPRGRMGEHVLPSELLEPVQRDRSAASGKELINRLLAAKPEARYGTPEELVADFDALLGGRGLALPWDELGVEDVGTPQIPAPPKARFTLVTEAGVRVSLTADEIIVGRSTPDDPGDELKVDISKLDAANPLTVSRRHCRLARDEAGGYRLEDLGSFNGTWVNGERLKEGEQRLLVDGDELHVGAVKFRWEARDETSQAE
ncbi:MAG: protein kinase [Anaerolineales bacterium]